MEIKFIVPQVYEAYPFFKRKRRGCFFIVIDGKMIGMQKTASVPVCLMCSLFGGKTAEADVFPVTGKGCTVIWGAVFFCCRIYSRKPFFHFFFWNPFLSCVGTVVTALCAGYTGNICRKISKYRYFFIITAMHK